MINLLANKKKDGGMAWKCNWNYISIGNKNYAPSEKARDTRKPTGQKWK